MRLIGNKLLKIMSWLGLILLGLSGYAQAQPCGIDFSCHEALVQFNSKLSQSKIHSILQHRGATVEKYYKYADLFLIRLAPNTETLPQIESLRKQPGVRQAVPNHFVHANALPNDTRFDELWGMSNTGQEGGTVAQDIGMPEAWDQFTDGSNVIVGIIDSGADYLHPDLAGNIWTNSGEIAGNGIDDDSNGYIDDIHGYDFLNNDGDPMDDNGHGTHVAGTIGAIGNNGLGVAGINWQAQIMVLKFLDSAGNGSISDAIEAMEYATDQGATILNNSWGTNFKNDALELAVGATNDSEIIFVAAAGNSRDDLDKGRTEYPAAYSFPNVISVLATTRFDDIAYFSNYGAVSVDLGAPGEDVLSTVPTWYFAGSNDYDFFDGTSMATPHVAGAAALLWSNFSDLTHLEIIELLLLGVTPKEYLQGMCVTEGQLNLANSIDFALNGIPNQPPVANAGPDQKVFVGELVTLQGSGSGSDPNGDTPLFYSWELQAPGGSVATLNNSGIAQPSFTPDVEGTYTATLVVNDGEADSDPDAATVTATLPPGPMPSPSPSPSPQPSPSPSPSPAPSPIPEPTPSPTPTVAPTVEPVPTDSPTPNEEDPGTVAIVDNGEPTSGNNGGAQANSSGGCSLQARINSHHFQGTWLILGLGLLISRKRLSKHL